MAIEFEVLEVKENTSGGISVKTRCMYGINTFGLGAHTKFIDAVSGKPKWLLETAKLLDGKYGATPQARIPKDVDKTMWAKKFKTDTLDEVTQ